MIYALYIVYNNHKIYDGGVCMANSAMIRFLDAARVDSVYEQTVSYLQRHMQQFLRPQDRVLICNMDRGQFSMTAMLEKAVWGLGAIPLQPEDCRWQTMLKKAFFSRATVVVGPPLMMLGLTKLAKHTGTPLNIRHVLLAGAPSEDWMIDGIQNGLDASIWGCYDPVPGLVVGGFSCTKCRGVHIREDVLDIRTHPDSGEIQIAWKHQPDAVYATGERGRLCFEKCACGSWKPRLLDFAPMERAGDHLESLRAHLLSWTSVLDYRAQMTRMGLELELIVFPGERLPQLPSCARRLVRQWVPKEDIPFFADFSPKIG